jgi:hypothetical protein
MENFGQGLGKLFFCMFAAHSTLAVESGIFHDSFGALFLVLFLWRSCRVIPVVGLSACGNPELLEILRMSEFSGIWTGCS